MILGTAACCGSRWPKIENTSFSYRAHPGAYQIGEHLGARVSQLEERVLLEQERCRQAAAGPRRVLQAHELLRSDIEERYENLRVGNAFLEDENQVSRLEELLDKL